MNTPQLGRTVRTFVYADKKPVVAGCDEVLRQGGGITIEQRSFPRGWSYVRTSRERVRSAGSFAASVCARFASEVFVKLRKSRAFAPRR